MHARWRNSDRGGRPEPAFNTKWGKFASIQVEIPPRGGGCSPFGFPGFSHQEPGLRSNAVWFSLTRTTCLRGRGGKCG